MEMDAEMPQRSARAKSVAYSAELSRRRASSSAAIASQGPLLSAAAERRLQQATQGATTATIGEDRPLQTSRQAEDCDERKRRLQEERDRRLMRAGLEPASRPSSSHSTDRDRRSFQPQAGQRAMEGGAAGELSSEHRQDTKLRLQIKHRLSLQPRSFAQQENRVSSAQSSPQSSAQTESASHPVPEPAVTQTPAVAPKPRLQSPRKAAQAPESLRKAVLTSKSPRKSAAPKESTSNQEAPSRSDVAKTPMRVRRNTVASRLQTPTRLATPTTSSPALRARSSTVVSSAPKLRNTATAIATGNLKTTSHQSEAKPLESTKASEPLVGGATPKNTARKPVTTSQKPKTAPSPERSELNIAPAKVEAFDTSETTSKDDAPETEILLDADGEKTPKNDLGGEDQQQEVEEEKGSEPDEENRGTIVSSKKASAADEEERGAIVSSKKASAPDEEERGAIVSSEKASEPDEEERGAVVSPEKASAPDDGERGAIVSSGKASEPGEEKRGTIDETLLESLQKSLSLETPVRELRSTSASSVPADLMTSATRSSPVVEARRAETPTAQGHLGGRAQPESLLGRVLSHGIQLALAQDKLQPQRETRSDDFGHFVQHQPYLELSARRTVQFRLTDWCPVVFRNLRKQQEIDEDEYLASMCGEALRGGSQGSGKSGAIFFKSADQKFIIKEVRRSERETLLRILSSMAQHLSAFPHTYLPRFLGLYTVEAIPDVLPQSMTIVVMTNVLEFPPKDRNLHFNEVYDLKGSVHNRFTCSPNKPLQTSATPPIHRTVSMDGIPSSASKRLSLQHTHSSPSSVCSTPGAGVAAAAAAAAVAAAGVVKASLHSGAQGEEPTAGSSAYSTPTTQTRRGSTGTTPPGSKPFVLKDLNLRSRFALGAKRKALLVSQLQHDVEWLERHNLMDYSFLVGVAADDKLDPSPFVSAGGSATPSQPQLQSQSQRAPPGTALESLESPSGIPFPALASSPGQDVEAPPSSCKTSDGFESFVPVVDIGGDEAHSELGAILRRNRLQRQETASLLPEGATVKLQLIGHGKAKRSRESSTIFRQSCTLYSFLVTREMSVRANEGEAAATLKAAAPVAAAPEVQWIVFRRYKDFEKLQKGLQDELKRANSALRLPALPRKQMIGFMEPDFVRRRQKELMEWIQSILGLVNHRVESPVLHEFLTNKANKCPPKWQADRNLQQMVQRRISSPVILGASSRRSLASVGSAASGRRSSVRTSSICSGSTSSGDSTSCASGAEVPACAGPITPKRPRAASEASALSPELAQLMQPSSRSCLPLWATLGGPRHQSFDATRTSNATGRAQQVKLFVGIIDILQEFNLSKKLESVFKGLTQHADGISAVDPERYGERFLAFVDEFVFE